MPQLTNSARKRVFEELYKAAGLRSRCRWLRRQGGRGWHLHSARLHLLHVFRGVLVLMPVKKGSGGQGQSAAW